MASERRTGFLFEPKRQFSEEKKESDDGNSTDDTDIRLDDDRTENLCWCTCENCVIMPSRIECVCCRENVDICRKMDVNIDKCIQSKESLKTLCLDKEILVLMSSIKEVVGEDLRDPISNRLYRYTAYQSFTWWIYGKLGRKVRRIIPACVVTCIRAHFPEEDVTNGIPVWLVSNLAGCKMVIKQHNIIVLVLV
ncbi:P2X purinoceptor 7-like [Anneissia japonica]|uniref:P2X purinoceptor 7-like n=1 Tax=Anneissia japonica TaxID=1529436 RepID=UPI0014258C23|nr:P2X purinoceptor 7-like [Anneissia japonica]